MSHKLGHAEMGTIAYFSGLLVNRNEQKAVHRFTAASAGTKPRGACKASQSASCWTAMLYLWLLRESKIVARRRLRWPLAPRVMCTRTIFANLIIRVDNSRQTDPQVQPQIESKRFEELNRLTQCQRFANVKCTFSFLKLKLFE